MISGRATVLDWSRANNFLPKRKRAALVCMSCHSRKIRCDLELSQEKGRRSCSSCVSSGTDCHVRRSRRRNRRVSKLSSPRRSMSSHSDTTPPNGALLDPSEVRKSADPPPATSTERPSIATMTTISPKTLHEPQPPLREDLRSAPIEFTGPNLSSNTPEVVVTDPSIAVTPSMTQSHEGDLDTGFLQVFAPEYTSDNQFQSLELSSAVLQSHKPLPAKILHVFVNTYFEYCYTWCPVLDRSSVFSEVARSSMLSNALAVAASHVRPPLISTDGPADYYSRARQIFYNDEELDAMATLKSLLLFYWWAPKSSSTVHRHSSWFWTSIVIRQGHQMNLHRNPSADQVRKSGVGIGIRRRIWWTAFARERLVALSQSKPAIINLKDCTLGEPTLDDFPSDGPDLIKAEIFIQWVRLCVILGKIAKYLSRTLNATSPTAFPQHLSHELVDWIRALPPHLKLPVTSSYTANFDRDVYQLHLPYLAAIIVLHLHKSSEPVPLALPPAILAASCVARIFNDILERGDTCFLPAMTSWYCGISFITLLNASSNQCLEKAAEAELDIIALTADRLRCMWASANVIYEGFGRLRNQASKATVATNGESNVESIWNVHPCRSASAIGGIHWMDYFPFVSQDTSEVANILLMAEDRALDGYSWMPDYTSLNLQDWFDLDDDAFTSSGAFLF